MNLSQVNNILLAQEAGSKKKVKKIIRRKKVKNTKRSSKSPLKPDWDSNNKIVGTEGDDYNRMSNRLNAKQVDLSNASSPSKNASFSNIKLRDSSNSPDLVNRNKR